MGALDGRVAIITGAGRGIGREHALLFGAEGAKVVVNDLGGESDGSGADPTSAEHVVTEIRAAGGEAIANGDDVTSADGADCLVQAALEAFGQLDVLVNNAGILRDRMLVNMSDAEWDDVINVHLRGHFMPLRAAGRYWREQSRAGAEVHASVINTSSTSGLFGQIGQANYGAAKAGIASMAMIAESELSRYGVRVNSICPAARTRLTAGLAEAESLETSGEFDQMHPGNISPFVGYLATRDCPITGRTFFVFGSEVHLFQPWAIVDKIETNGRWTIAQLEKEAPRLGEFEFTLNRPFS